VSCCMCKVWVPWGKRPHHISDHCNDSAQHLTRGRRKAGLPLAASTKSLLVWERNWLASASLIWSMEAGIQVLDVILAYPLGSVHWKKSCQCKQSLQENTHRFI
jgi:hypothetical protein